MPTKAEPVYLPSAKRDLREILQYHIEHVGVRSARSIYQMFRADISRLMDFPLSGPPVPDPELAVLGYRKLVLTKTYIAIYKVIDGSIYIYRIVNGRTDYPKLLK